MSYKTHFSIVAVALSLVLSTNCNLHAKAQDGSTAPTWAFGYNGIDRPGSLLNLRSLNEKTAGESGFVRLSKDGRDFVTGSGNPLRFWSVVTDGYHLKQDELARHARFLASIGVNMVRLHTQICSSDTNSAVTDVNKKEIDDIWRCVAAMKKEGIYCTISPYWATGKNATNWGIEGYSGTTDLWGVLFFDPQLQKGYKAWVKELYTHPNPYTNVPLCNDPAVALIQVQNEDGMFFWTMQGLHPEQKRALGKLFASWAIKKYGSADAVRSAWSGAINPPDDLEHGSAVILDTWMLTQQQTGGFAVRTADQTHFFAETQRGFYRSIADYYHNTLGCKQLINASNWITADPIHLNDAERYTNAAVGLDVLAVNRYTGGVHTGANNGWRIDPGHHFTNNSCLLDPRSMPFNLKQVAGHPMVITESSWVNPEGYQSEATFLAAAYESLTGVSSLYWFATGGTPDYDPDPYFNFLNINGHHPMNKWTCSTPMLAGSFPASALMYRLEYITRGKPAVHEVRSLEDLWQRKDPILAEDKTFDPNRNTGNTGGKSTISRGVDPLAFLVGPVEVEYGGDSSKSVVSDLSRYIDSSRSVVTSNTGEIRLDYGKGICTVNAPRAQGATGFLKADPTVTLTDVTIHCTDSYATIVCVSMDKQPLATSKKILVQMCTRARPTNWSAKPSDFPSDDGKQTFHGFEIVDTGSMPWRINSLNATIFIKNRALTHATILDSGGYALKVIQGKVDSGAFDLTLPPDAMYAILE